MNFHKFLLYLHLVVGLAAALVLVALGLTGAALVFEAEIDHALNADLKRVRPEGEHLPLKALAEKLEQAHPGTKLSAVVIAEDDDLAFRATLSPLAGGKSLDLAVNPYTGKELVSLSPANNFPRKLLQFHKNLLLGENGKLITGFGSILLLVLAGTGLVLWWPRKIWKLRAAALSSRVNFHLHNVIGFYSSVFMLVFGLTGVVIHWENEATQLVNHLAGATETPAVPKPRVPSAGAAALSADQALAAALKAVPGARVTSIQGLGSLTPVRITMKYPEDHTPSGRTNLYLDPTTGEVLSAQTSRTAPLGIRVVKLWNRQIHTGDIFGWPTRLLACAASLALPVLAITGPLIWWFRLRRKRQAA